MSARLLICFLQKKIISILMKHISTYMQKKSLQMQTTHGYFLICLYLVVCFIFICSPFLFFLFPSFGRSLSLFDVNGFFCVFVFTRRISPTRSHASHEIFPIHIGIRFLNMVWQAGSIMVFQISIKIMQHAHTTNIYNFDLNCQWYGQMMSKWFDKMYKSNADKMFLV